MKKKTVWMTGSAVFLFLLICTVLSFRVEKMMRIEVEVTVASQSEEEKAQQLAEIPLSCYPDRERLEAIFCLEEREGLFGKELVAVRKEIYPIYEEGNMAVIPDSGIRDDEGRLYQIVSYSTYLLEDGDVVVMAGEEARTVPPGRVGKLPDGVLIRLEEAVGSSEIRMAEDAGYEIESAGTKGSGIETYDYHIRKKNGQQIHIGQVSDFTWELFGRPIEGEVLDLSSHRQMAGQIRTLAWMAALLPISLIIFAWSVKKIGAFQEQKWIQGGKGIILFAVWLVFAYYLIGRLDIPREFLPPQQILDVKFYADEVRMFFSENVWGDQKIYQLFRTCLQRELVRYGFVVIGAWAVSLLFCLSLYLFYGKIKITKLRKQL